MRGAAEVAALLLVVALTGGCAPPIGVGRMSPEDANRALGANVLNAGEVSGTAAQFLFRLNLTDLFEKNPEAALGKIHEGLGGTDEPDRLFALAELSFKYASDRDDQRYHLAAAAYAWAFLFPRDSKDRPDRYDPRVRAAMDLYNRGITAGLAKDPHDEESGLDLSRRSVPLPFGQLDIEVDPTGFRYGGYQLRRFTPLADLRVRGLRNRYRRRGIGSPLAARIRRAGDESIDQWIAGGAKVPLTLLLRFDEPRTGMEQHRLRATIELHDVDVESGTAIGRDHLPFEAETTATLAYGLEGSPLWDFEIAGFRRSDLSLFGDNQEGALFMIHPYQPGRIPVVFVHGTASSPARWAEMVNELMNDRVLGRRYQFWYFMYNTGNPIGYSAMFLRESLRDAVAAVDPEGNDPALRRMVVVGHSQGGLLSKMTSVSAGTRFWQAISDKPFEEAELDEEARDLVRRSYFVEPLPFVERLVFIATPHRGSFLADNFLGNVARKLVSLPGTVTQVSLELAKLQPAGALETALALPTSIDNMKWNNPFLKILSSLPIRDGVHVHSIVAIDGDGPAESGDDGVVAYSSAHLAEAESEFIVRSGHSTQSTPETIEEVRRILHAHLALESTPEPPPTAIP